MTTKRQLWIDTQGQPVVTTTPNGERNAARWGWIRAVAMTKVEYDLLAPDPTGPDEREALDYTDIANRGQAETGRSSSRGTGEREGRTAGPVAGTAGAAGDVG